MKRFSGKAKLKYGTVNCLSTEYVSRPIFTAAGEEIVFGRAVDRLAAYEDTGLEPEEIKGRIQAGEELFFECSDLYAELGPIEHLRALVQAEKDGRLVVLPEVSERDRKAFIDGSQDYFQEASFCDPSTGIFGMSEGEKKLVSALMNALTQEKAEGTEKEEGE